MKNILLPTDFSENAYNAIKYAVQFFQNQKCRFILLNTYTPVLYDPQYLMYNVSQPTLYDIFKSNSEENLKRLQERVQKNFSNLNHEFEGISSFNTLTEEIREISSSKNIELIVMGTKGATGAKEILFGSNTVQVMNKAKCPLLAIPEHFEFKKISNILFPTDFDLKYSEKHLRLLKEIAKYHEARIKILKIYLKFPFEDEQEQNKKILKEKLQNEPHTFFNIENESVTEGIFNFQKENNIDLLAMINNKHSFFENLLFQPVINKIGFHIKEPFLVIPS